MNCTLNLKVGDSLHTFLVGTDFISNLKLGKNQRLTHKRPKMAARCSLHASGLKKFKPFYIMLVCFKLAHLKTLHTKKKQCIATSKRSQHALTLRQINIKVTFSVETTLTATSMMMVDTQVRHFGHCALRGDVEGFNLKQKSHQYYLVSNVPMYGSQYLSIMTSFITTHISKFFVGATMKRHFNTRNISEDVLKCHPQLQ